MAKIMAVNAGSSSIKFQLLEMPEEKVIASTLLHSPAAEIEIKAKNQCASVWLIRDNNYILVKDDVDLLPYTTEEAGGFVGCTVGMYTSSNGEESSNNCDFSWLSVTELR